MGDIEFAPTFRPTAEDFLDPLQYIKSISRLGSTFGIIKIQPPSDFEPSLNLLENAQFQFKTRNQIIGSLNGNSRLQLCYSQQLYKYHQAILHKVYRVPEIDGRHVNMFLLAKLSRKSKNPLLENASFWKEITLTLSFPPNYGGKMKALWEEWIQPFQEFLDLGDASTLTDTHHPVSQMKQVNRPPVISVEKPIDAPLLFSPIDSFPESLSDYEDQQLQSNFIAFCKSLPKIRFSKPLTKFKYLSFFEDKRKPPFYGSLDKSSFIISARNPFKKDETIVDYESDSSIEWSHRKHFLSESEEEGFTHSESEEEEESNDEEFGRTSTVVRRTRQSSSSGLVNSKKKRVKRNISFSPPPEKLKKSPPKAAPSRNGLDPKELFPNGNEVCSQCNLAASDTMKIAICDDCENAFHYSCVTPALIDEPTVSWFCRQCIIKAGHFFGFKDNEEPRNLIQFKSFADKFKCQYLKDASLTESDIENEFWRLTELPFEDVTVEYGADLHTSIHGSGFPTSDENPYSSHPWNLNRLPVEKESFFRMIKQDIPGMMVPWVYVGMLFSAFCWHFEDHYTYSINYLHTGSPKSWYGIPASSADKFEEVMRKENADLFEADPDLLFHLTTILSPYCLKEAGTSVFKIQQNPGEFVVTFPRAYHAGFNNGFNIAEAVNFATADWLSFGGEVVDLYARYKKAPVFSHEELVINTIRSTACSPGSFLYLKKAFEVILNKEMKGRSKCGLPTKKNVSFLNVSTEENQCSICKKSCFLSFVKCASCSGVVCAEHWNLLDCPCDSPRRELVYIFSVSELVEMSNAISFVSMDAQDWMDKGAQLLEQKNIHLYLLKEHLAKAWALGLDSFQVENITNRIKAIESVQLKMRQTLKAIDRKYSLSDLVHILDRASELSSIFPEFSQLAKMHGLALNTNDQFLTELGIKEFHKTEDLERLMMQIEEFPLILPASETVFHLLKRNRFMDAFNQLDFKNLDVQVASEMLLKSEDLKLVHCSKKLQEFLRTAQEKAYSEEEDRKRVESACRAMLKQNDRYYKKEHILFLNEEMTRLGVSSQIKEDFAVAVFALSEWSDEYIKNGLDRPVHQWSNNEDIALSLIEKGRALAIPILELKELISSTDEWKLWKENWLTSMRSRLDFSMTVRFVRQSIELAAMESDYPTNCICRSNNPGSCIQCASCSTLYHTSCLGSGEFENPYHCPCCRITRSGFNPFQKPTLNHVKSLLDQSIQLKVSSRERGDLIAFIDSLLKWLSDLKLFLDGVRDIFVLRDWLRRLYGLPFISELVGKLERRIAHSYG